MSSRFALQCRNVGAAGVAHAGAQAADELMDHRGHAALVGHAALDAFGHQLLDAFGAFEVELVLEVAIAATPAHGAQRAHPAVFLEAAALVEDELAWTFVGARKQAADHDGAGADR